MRNPLRLCFILFTFMTGLACGAEPITCALIADKGFGLAESPMVQLLQVELGRDSRLAMVERAEVNKVVEENALQASLGADGGESRVRLGDLLRARLLLILRISERRIDAKTTTQVLTVVAADSSNGLRLQTAAHKWNPARPEQAVRLVLGDVADAQAKLAEHIRAVVAVAPFVCDDFTYYYRFCQDPYASIVRRETQKTSGVLCVETKEAQSIAEEQGLHGLDTIRRPVLAYFILGHFRNEGEGSSRRVRVSLQLKQGEKLLAKKESPPLAPDAVAPFLCQTTSEFLRSSLRIAPAPFDPVVEAAELWRLAREHESLGEYSAAFDLIQSAVLLHPSAELYAAGIALSDSASRCAPLGAESATQEEQDQYMLACLHARLGMLEHLFRTKEFAKNPSAYGYNDDRIYGSPAFAGELASPDIAVRRQFREYQLRRREIILSYLESARSNDTLTTQALFRLCNPHNIPLCIEPPESWQGTHLRMLRLLQAWPGKGLSVMADVLARERRIYESMYRVMPGLANEQYDSFLDRAATLPGVASKVLSAENRIWREFPPVPESASTEATSLVYSARAKDLQELLDFVRSAGLGRREREALSDILFVERRKTSSFIRQPKQAPTPVPQTDGAVGTLVFRKFEGDDDPLDAYLNQSGIKGTVYLTNVLACPNGVDLYIMSESPANQARGPQPRMAQVLAMRKKGVFEHVFTFADGSVTNLVWDGKNAWAGGTATLVMIDPASLKTRTFGKKDGLLPGRVWVGAMAPGRVCGIGFFGRTWMAKVQVESDKARVEVFHEAPLASGGPTDVKVAFEPSEVYGLYDSATPSDVTFLVGAREGFPRLVNPERKTVSVLEFRMDGYPHTILRGNYYQEVRPNTYCRIGPPNYRPEDIVAPPVGGEPLPPHMNMGMFSDGDRMYMIGDLSFLIDIDARVMRPLTVIKEKGVWDLTIGNGLACGPSNHYGNLMGWPCFESRLNSSMPTVTSTPKAPERISQISLKDSPFIVDAYGRLIGVRELPDTPTTCTTENVTNPRIRREIMRAKEAAMRPYLPVVRVPGDIRTRTIGDGRYETKEYFHTFALEGRDGKIVTMRDVRKRNPKAWFGEKEGLFVVADSEETMDNEFGDQLIRLQPYDISLSGKTILDGDFVPTGVYVLSHGHGMVRYDPLVVTPESPEQLVFRPSAKSATTAPAQ